MEQSATYQAIVRHGREEGRAEEARNLLLLQGTSKFGSPGPEVRGALNRMADLAQLEELGVRLLGVSSWQELLASTPRRRKRGRRS